MKTILKFIVVLAVLAMAVLHWIVPGVVEREMNQVVGATVPAVSTQAQALHDTLFVADLHADSLLWKRNLLKRSNTGHIDLPRLREGNVALQVFSATTKSPSGLNYEKNTAETDDITTLALLSFWPTRTWDSLYERALYQLEKLHRFARRSNNQLVLIKSQRDLAQLLQRREAGENVVGGVFLIEGAHPLEGRLENLQRLYEAGMRIAGLTHFFDNEIGGSLHGLSNAGLTDFGRDVVKKANELNVILDVAHASPNMVREVLALSTTPVMLSHGGLKGQCPAKRNLDDRLMLELASKGGLLGVGYWGDVTCEQSVTGIVKSLRYAIDLMGLAHVALGSDFDGTVTTPLDTSQLAALTQVMMDEGFTQAEIQAVMGGNALRFFQQHLPVE